MTSILALFDIDGTLLTCGGAGSRTLDAVFEKRYGVSGAMTAISCAGKTDPAIVTELFWAGLGRAPDEAELWAIVRDYEDALPGALAANPGFALLPAVAHALDMVGARHQSILGIATGNTQRGARAKLERAGIHQRFVVGGYGCDHVERPRLVARAIERAIAHAGRGFSGHEVVVIGDTPRDVAAAHACGAACVAVATGSYGEEALRDAGADACIATLADLEAALDALA